MISLVFFVPALILLFNALTMNIVLLWILAFFLCPLLSAIGLMFFALKSNASINRSTRETIRSICLFQLKKTRIEILPLKGSVEIWSDLTTPSKSQPYWWYHVTVQAVPGLTFSVASDYRKALEFANQLTEFLGYDFNDASDPKSRR